MTLHRLADYQTAAALEKAAANSSHLWDYDLGNFVACIRCRVDACLTVDLSGKCRGYPLHAGAPRVSGGGAK